MSLDAASVERGLLALDPEERAAVIRQGLLSLDTSHDMDHADVQNAWYTEVHHRVDSYVNGDEPLVDAGEHLARLRAQLLARDQ
ncbi:addiction module protein [Ornithinimicrobium faecis]|uniref:addiction module protein n=1 Tax=Ornithinimicrobium faecis TaxID=2934158 RepID=UPI002118C059|nr:addiction module protein [Ornithinimicrobium sp. HY1745]